MTSERRSLWPAFSHDRSGEREKSDLVQLCGFRVGDEDYALGIERIKEIINPLPIRRVPKSPSFVEGVVELRGQVLPVIDMRKRFDVPLLTATELEDPATRRARKYLIVPINERQHVGLIVDKVSDVLRVARETVGPPPPLTQNEFARYFAGVCHHRGRILMVLALDALLSATEKTNLAELNQSAKGALT